MKWHEIYKNQIKQANKSLESIDKDKVESFINILEHSNGIIFFAGIGKNGHVAAKTSSTYSSMNIKSFFIDPVDALHGGISVIGDDDVVVAISKSGSTGELHHFLEKLKNKNKKTKVILIHSNPLASCKQFSSLDIQIDIPEEHDKFNIIPITSISIFTIFLQSVGVEISYRNNLTKEEFLINHPGGSIGKNGK